MKLEEAEVGRKVIYTPFPGGEVEEGIITSFNHKNIFVRYGNDQHSKATSPEDISYI